MTNESINITIHSPDLIWALKQLAETLSETAMQGTVQATVTTGPSMRQANGMAGPSVPHAPTAPGAAPLPPVPTGAFLPAQAAGPVPVSAAPTYTLDALARAGATLAQSGKMEEALALLSRYGIQTVSHLKPEQYGAFATELRALGAQV